MATSVQQRLPLHTLPLYTLTSYKNNGSQHWSPRSFSVIVTASFASFSTLPLYLTFKNSQIYASPYISKLINFLLHASHSRTRTFINEVNKFIYLLSPLPPLSPSYPMPYCQKKVFRLPLYLGRHLWMIPYQATKRERITNVNWVKDFLWGFNLLGKF